MSDIVLKNVNPPKMDAPDGMYLVKDGVTYQVTPRMKLPLAKKINLMTGEISYPSNADRIRAMSYEELADFLCHWDNCKTTEGLGYNTENVYGTWICTAPGGGDINGECQVCALAWLKQEVDNG